MRIPPDPLAECLLHLLSAGFRLELKLGLGFWRLFGIFLALGTAASADERIRPLSGDELTRADKETAVRVVGAKVSYANFHALRRDFPQVKHLSDAQISQWVLDNFAFINHEQLRLNGIRNTTIPTDPNTTKPDFRPPSYGRAGVVEATYEGQTIGLVDIKGLGHRKGAADYQVKEFADAKGDPKLEDKLRTAGHSDGLMRHGEAVAEVSRQTAIQRLYDIHNKKNSTDFETVESYFVIELPFDVMGPNGGRDRAALYGRQAHWRGGSGVPIAPSTYRDPYGGLQGTDFRSSVDFGGALVDGDPRLKENFSVFPGQADNDPQKSKPWAWGHDVARAFERGDPSAVYRHLDEMLKPIEEEWKLHQPSVEPRAAELQELFIALRAARSSTASDADFEKLVAFMKNPGSGEKSRLTRRAIGRHISDERAAQLLQRIPGLVDHADFMSHRRPGFFLGVASTSDPAMAEVAVKLLPKAADATEPVLSAVVRLAREFPSVHSSLADWLSLARDEIVSKAKGSGKSIGQDANFAHLIRALGILLDGPAGAVRLKAALAIQKAGAAASDGGVFPISLPLWEKAVSVLRESALGKNSEEEAARFQSLDAHGRMRAWFPASVSAAPDHDSLRKEVNDGFVAELSAIVELRRRVARSAQLSKRGMVDERLEGIQLEALLKLIQDPSIEFADRRQFWNAYKTLIGSAKVIGTFPTADHLGEEMVASQIADVASRPHIGRVDGYDKLLAEGIDVAKVRVGRLETLLEMIRNPGEVFHNRTWALDKYRDADLTGIERAGGQTFPARADLIEELSRAALVGSGSGSRPRLTDVSELLAFGLHTPTVIEAAVSILRAEVPSVPEPIPSTGAYGPEAEAIRKRIQERAKAIEALVKAAPADDRVLDLAIWMKQHDVAEATQGFARLWGYSGGSGVQDRLNGTNLQLRLLTLLSVPVSEIYYYRTAYQAALDDTYPVVQQAAGARLVELFLSRRGTSWDGLGKDLLTYLKKQIEGLPPLDPRRSAALLQYTSVYAVAKLPDGVLPSPGELNTRFLADLEGNPPPAGEHERIEWIRAIHGLRGSLSAAELATLRSALFEAMSPKGGADTVQREQTRRVGFALWLEKSNPTEASPISDKDLLVAALRDTSAHNRGLILNHLAKNSVSDQRLVPLIATAASKGSPQSVVLAAKAISAISASDDGRLEVFLAWIRRGDLDGAQLADVVKAAKTAGFSSPAWIEAMVDIIEKTPHEGARAAALEEMVAGTKRSRSIPTEHLARLSRLVGDSTEEAYYKSASKAALTALEQYGVVHEDLVRALEEASHSANEERLARIFEVARKLRIDSPVLMDRAKQILRETAKSGKGLVIPPADYLVSRSPILGGFFFSARVKEMDRNGHIYATRSALEQSAVRRVKFILRSGEVTPNLCKDFLRALHPMSAQRPGDKALAIGFPALMTGILGGGGYLIYSISHDFGSSETSEPSTEVGTPELRKAPRTPLEGTGAIEPARQAREGTLRKSCLAGGGSMRAGVCVCDAAGGRTMNAWHDLCVKYR